MYIEEVRLLYLVHVINKAWVCPVAIVNSNKRYSRPATRVAIMKISYNSSILK